MTAPSLWPSPLGRSPLPDFSDENEPTDPRRIVPAGSMDRHDPPLGRIVTLHHGGAQRPVITRGGPHLRFRISSRKTGMTEVGEGKGEEFLAMYCEVNGEVLNYKCHPYRFETALGGIPFTYRPDIAILWRNGLFEIVEVKRTPRDLDDENRARLAWIREFLRRCGWHFTIRYLPEIYGSKHRKHNVEHIFGRRALKLSHKELAFAQNARSYAKAIEWGQLAKRCCGGDDRRGNAIVECLVARGWFTLNFDAPLSPSTILTPTRDVPQRLLAGFEGAVV